MQWGKTGSESSHPHHKTPETWAPTFLSSSTSVLYSSSHPLIHSSLLLHSSPTCLSSSLLSSPLLPFLSSPLHSTLLHFYSSPTPLLTVLVSHLLQVRCNRLQSRAHGDLWTVIIICYKLWIEAGVKWASWWYKDAKKDFSDQSMCL